MASPLQQWKLSRSSVVACRHSAPAPAQVTGPGSSLGIFRLTVLAADEVVIGADEQQIPVGIDGESALMPTPVRRTIGPLALRVPRNRPGVPDQPRQAGKR